MLPVVDVTKGDKPLRLGFGTSRLHYIDTHRRQKLLAEAAELGFTHYDTAPAYGDGLAEREIGRFVKGKRARFIIATKFGIPANSALSVVPALSLPVRGIQAIARRAGIRRALPPITAHKLRQSIEQSLRRLGIDWVDILFLHEPNPERIPSVGSVLEELISLRQRGLIRHFGLAGTWRGIADLGDAGFKIGQVVQTHEFEWPENRIPDITYGAISQGPQSAFAPSIDTTLALQRVESALRRRPQGLLLVSTTKPENLRLLAQVVQAGPQGSENLQGRNWTCPQRSRRT